MDYQELGFKCGIEIHQRLNTKKLFCECYCDPNKGNDDAQTGGGRKITRRLHAVVGELGKVDPAAAFEALRGKKYTYLVDEGTSCAIEADEEPPHQMNSEALKIGLVFSTMLDAKIIDEIFVMRKTVIDGSAVSGFQRTALIAVDGKIQTSKGEVFIPTIALEEESSGIIEKKGDETLFRLGRQGIPLLEVATSPTLKDGNHAMEAAEKIGGLMRSTGKVQRGLGSIRQDLNISISQGARVEIKGVQDLKLIPKLIENEVSRQINLLKIRGEILGRHILLGEEHFGVRDVTDAFSNTGCKLIREALNRNESVFALKLISFAGLFKTPLMPSHTLGAEIAGYARAHSAAKGIIHSDEALEEKYAFNLSEINGLETAMNAGDEDLIVMCVGTKELCGQALRVAFDRCAMLQKGVPEETRRAEGEISIFMRPLPGSARMYPETDLLPMEVGPAMLDDAKNGRPESPEEKKAKYLKWGLNEQLSDKMVGSQEWGKFESMVLVGKASAPLLAITLLETLVSLKRDGAETGNIADEHLISLSSFYSSGKITKSAIPEMLKLICKSPLAPLGDLIAQNSLSRIPKDQIRLLASKLEGTPEKKFAELMRKYRLQIEVTDLKEALEKP